MNLETILFEQTKELKENYCLRVKQWAEKEFDSFENLNWVLKTTNGWSKKWYGKTRSEDAKMNKILLILFRGKSEFIQKANEDAEKHYISSIKKLSNRIQEKGLNLNNLEIITNSEMEKGNISTTISDGIKTLRAFTILAWGNIQKPHYRYLIK